ncbi:MAG: OmpA family protein, partial [Chloroherpetonaceae bacterium]
NRSDLNPTNKRIAEFIDSDIRDDASVQVIGHTDRIGNDDYNKKLSDERAKSTAGVLKNKNVDAFGVGEQDLIYDNTTPEGRFYCRTVQVIVKQKN